MLETLTPLPLLHLMTGNGVRKLPVLLPHLTQEPGVGVLIDHPLVSADISGVLPNGHPARVFLVEGPSHRCFFSFETSQTIDRPVEDAK